MRRFGALEHGLSALLVALMIATVGMSMHVSYATHLPCHRYWVYGYVKDADGNPLAGRLVKANYILKEEGKMAISVANTALTDSKGYFEILLHLHDENLGDTITITVEGVSVDVIATFNPNDCVTERRHPTAVNLVVPSRGDPLPIAFGVLGLLGLAFIVLGFRARQRNIAEIQRRGRRRQRMRTLKKF